MAASFAVLLARPLLELGSWRRARGLLLLLLPARGILWLLRGSGCGCGRPAGSGAARRGPGGRRVRTPWRGLGAPLVGWVGELAGARWGPAGRGASTFVARCSASDGTDRRLQEVCGSVLWSCHRSSPPVAGGEGSRNELGDVVVFLAGSRGVWWCAPSALGAGNEKVEPSAGLCRSAPARHWPHL